MQGRNISEGGEFWVKGRYICICLRVGGWDLTKQLGCVLIMLGLVWLFKENLKDNLIH